MKIGLTSTGKTLDSMMDQRFGRASYFILLDTDTSEFEALPNEASMTAGGSGTFAAQVIADKGVSAVITGNVGPNAMNVLKAADIGIYRGYPATINDNIEKYKRGRLERVDQAGPSHFGMSLKRNKK
ncbi:MAG: NifB/NifX family molybdenum-iron cluster-binding protein [Clostridia bacterium]|jgi:predicted Fe-Mo cluster-binding NifX family protein|nr:NifB/NifX family molybdenum-iron cluster-binding protein [Clostridia bacterium]